MRKQTSREPTSRYFGVYRHPVNPRWIAVIRHDGKRKYIGSFEYEEDAALAYDMRALQLFGIYTEFNLASTHRLITVALDCGREYLRERNQ